jgi:predicted amidohydrolase
MNDTDLAVALTQLVSSTEKEENLKTMWKYVKEAAKKNADLIAFPEGFMFHHNKEDGLEAKFKKSESINGRFVGEVRKMAKKYKISIIFGMNERPNKGFKTYNTTLALDEKGAIANIYRKTHLYDAFDMRESDQNIPGTEKPRVFKIKNIRVGVTVCYEIRFPEIARMLALGGAELIIVPSAWVKGYNKEDFWLSSIKTRAMENTVYVGTSNQIGNNYTGITSFVDPLGILVERATEEEGMFIQYVRKDRISQARKILPLLSQRNTSIYF